MELTKIIMRQPAPIDEIGVLKDFYLSKDRASLVVYAFNYGMMRGKQMERTRKKGKIR